MFETNRTTHLSIKKEILLQIYNHYKKFDIRITYGFGSVCKVSVRYGFLHTDPDPYIKLTLHTDRNSYVK